MWAIYTYYLLEFQSYSFFFFNDTATTEIYTLSLHDALPISSTPTRGGIRLSHRCLSIRRSKTTSTSTSSRTIRSEEHTSELQSPCNLVCRLLLEKKQDGDVVRLRRIRDALPVVRDLVLVRQL